MPDFCYVVERTEWGDGLYEKAPCWEHRVICRVCKSYEDAKAFVEKNSAMCGYPMRWRGELKYSGRSVMDGVTEEGLVYELHYGPIL